MDDWRSPQSERQMTPLSSPRQRSYPPEARKSFVRGDKFFQSVHFGLYNHRGFTIQSPEDGLIPWGNSRLPSAIPHPPPTPSMKNLVLALGVCIAATQSQAATFTIGQVGTTQPENNWPAGEHPGLAIDGVITTKYSTISLALLRKVTNDYNSGYIFTPTAGAAIVTGINFASANDAVERDPHQLPAEPLGSNTAVASSVVGTFYDLNVGWTQVATGPLTLPAARNTAGGNVTFANTTAYNTYLLVFPTVQNPTTANSMQIGEAVLQTRGRPPSNRWHHRWWPVDPRAHLRALCRHRSPRAHDSPPPQLSGAGHDCDFSKTAAQAAVFFLLSGRLSQHLTALTDDDSNRIRSVRLPGATAQEPYSLG